MLPPTGATAVVSLKPTLGGSPLMTVIVVACAANAEPASASAARRRDGLFMRLHLRDRGGHRLGDRFVAGDAGLVDAALRVPAGDLVRHALVAEDHRALAGLGADFVRLDRGPSHAA